MIKRARVSRIVEKSRLAAEKVVTGAQAGVPAREKPDSRFHGNDGLRRLAMSLLLVAAMLPACNSEILEKQAQQIKQQEAEIERQRQEISALRTKQKIQEQQQRDCNRAFRDYFEKAQAAPDREQAITLYRDGLSICPDDEVARFELGKVLAASGRSAEAAKEFEAALKLHPGFDEAKRQLDSLRSRR